VRQAGKTWLAAGRVRGRLLLMGSVTWDLEIAEVYERYSRNCRSQV